MPVLARLVAASVPAGQYIDVSARRVRSTFDAAFAGGGDSLEVSMFQSAALLNIPEL